MVHVDQQSIREDCYLGERAGLDWAEHEDCKGKAYAQDNAVASALAKSGRCRAGHDGDGWACSKLFIKLAESDGTVGRVDRLRSWSVGHVYTYIYATFPATLDPDGEEHLGKAGRHPTRRSHDLSMTLSASVRTR